MPWPDVSWSKALPCCCWHCCCILLNYELLLTVRWVKLLFLCFTWSLSVLLRILIGFHEITSDQKGAAEILLGKVKIVHIFSLTVCSKPHNYSCCTWVGGCSIYLIGEWSSLVIVCGMLKVDEVQCNLSPASLVNLIFPSEEFSPDP